MEEIRELKGEATRARLLSLLSEACELEHALACAYLFAAFSMKREISEGLTTKQVTDLRKWSSRIYHIAGQEMLHLAQAWNLLSAVGGTPYFDRPNFPQPARHYPLNAALQLRRCDDQTLTGFIYFEKPLDIKNVVLESREVDMPVLWPINESFEYQSVSELYGECLAIIYNISQDKLFRGIKNIQVDESLIDFPEIVQVYDRASARQAIEIIMEQGEGSPEDREDSHFGVFLAIREALRNADGFEVARPVGDNPYVRDRRDQMGMNLPAIVRSDIERTEVTHQYAIQAMDIFDDIYVAMLQAMAYAFSNVASQSLVLKELAESSLQLMITVIKPLGEAICLLPSGHAGWNAGPAFSFNRHVQLPADPEFAQKVYHERLAQLAEHAQLLADAPGDISQTARNQINGAAANIARLATGNTLRTKL